MDQNIASAFRINAPRMIHETLDQDTVVIDTETGVYFSLSGSGPLIWQMLETGAGTEAITSGLSAQYDAGAGTLRPLVEQFLAELSQAELIVPAVEAGPAAAGAGDDGAGRVAFAPPVLQTFTDMEELLLIDPIHEVEDTGWPHRSKQRRG